MQYLDSRSQLTFSPQRTNASCEVIAKFSNGSEAAQLLSASLSSATRQIEDPPGLESRRSSVLSWAGNGTEVNPFSENRLVVVLFLHHDQVLLSVENANLKPGPVFFTPGQIIQIGSVFFDDLLVPGSVSSEKCVNEGCNCRSVSHHDQHAK